MEPEVITKDQLHRIMKLTTTYWIKHIHMTSEDIETLVQSLQKRIDLALNLFKNRGNFVKQGEFNQILSSAKARWESILPTYLWDRPLILWYLNRAMNEVFAESVLMKHSKKSQVASSSPSKPSFVHTRNSSPRRLESKKSSVSKNTHVPVSTPTTPISISQAPVTPVSTTPISVSQVPSTPVFPVVRSKPIKHYGSVDNLVRYQFDICLAHIMFWPKFDVVSLRKTPAKVSFTPTFVAPVAEIHEVAQIDDGDSVYSETEDFPFRVPAVELFPEDQEQELNFIVEGCTFRGDIEIPTPPPSDSEQEDAPTENDGRPWKDVRIPSPTNERFIPSAAFSRSSGQEQRSNTPPDEFDRYLAESFRPVTVPLLPATPKAPPRQTASQKAATTGVARAARAVPSSDIVARRLSYSDASFIHQSHGERDPSRAAVSDEDARFDDDPDLDPDEWQDQALYDDMLCGIAAASPSSSHDGCRSDSSSSPEGFRFDEPQFDSDGRSIASTCSSPSRYPDSDIDDYCGDAADQYDYG